MQTVGDDSFLRKKEIARELFDELILSVYVDLSDLAWKSFLFDRGEDLGGCVARRRCNRLECAVFYKCSARVCEQDKDGRLCQQHWKQVLKKGAPQYGYWTQSDQNINDLSNVLQRNVIKEAQERSRRLCFADQNRTLDEPAVVSFSAACGHNKPELVHKPRRADAAAQRFWRGSYTVLRQKGLQPSFSTNVPGELRQFSTVATALPAHPCRLCHQNFAHVQDLHRHIKNTHKGLQEYRKRLWYEACGVMQPVRKVGPQVWRLSLATATEELITGSSSWPSCADDAGESVHAGVRKLLLGGLAGAIHEFGGVVAIMSAIGFDAERLLGDRCSAMSAVDVSHTLISEEASIYAEMLKHASTVRKKEKTERSEASFKLFVCMCKLALSLPLSLFWWDDGYVLEALSLEAESGNFVDHRLDRLGSALLGADTYALVISEYMGFSRLLREIRQRLPSGIDDTESVVSSWSSGDFACDGQLPEDTPAIFARFCQQAGEALLLNLVTFLLADGVPGHIFQHSGAALVEFAIRQDSDTSVLDLAPIWCFPTLEMPKESVPRWWRLAETRAEYETGARQDRPVASSRDATDEICEDAQVQDEPGRPRALGPSESMKESGGGLQNTIVDDALVVEDDLVAPQAADSRDSRQTDAVSHLIGQQNCDPASRCGGGIFCADSNPVGKCTQDPGHVPISPADAGPCHGGEKQQIASQHASDFQKAEEPDSVSHFEVLPSALGGESSPRRCRVRHETACAVCARRHWASEVIESYMFDAPPGREHEALLHNRELGSKPPTGHAEEARQLPAGQVTSCRRRLDDAKVLFSPERYWQRWCFAGEDESHPLRGIPLDELKASCVKSPVDGSLWLLHRKSFRVDHHGVADRYQKVPVCHSCHVALRGTEIRMPKYSLANDLWIGKMPRELRHLSEGAWMLLALARVSIKRYNCRSDGGHWLKKDEMIKAIIGNVCAFPQADGGILLRELPPTAKEMVERLQICFTDLDKDVERAYLKPLEVDLDDFKAAYDFFRKCNVEYSQVDWRKANEEQLKPCSEMPGIPRCFAPCLRKPFDRTAGEVSVRKEGPADACEDAVESALTAEDLKHVERVYADLVLWLENNEGVFPMSCDDQESEESKLCREVSLVASRLRHAARQPKTTQGELAAPSAHVENLFEAVATNERNETVVAIGDEDASDDVLKQWEFIDATFKRILANMEDNLNSDLRKPSEHTSGDDKDKPSTSRMTREEILRQLEALRSYAQEACGSDLRLQAEEAESRFEQTRKPPGWSVGSAQLLEPGGSFGCARLLVPDATAPLSMFDSHFWPCAFPRMFPYGDGGFGIQRDVEIKLEEYIRYILQREELDYPDIFQEPVPDTLTTEHDMPLETEKKRSAPSGPVPCDRRARLAAPPRWRDRDFVSGLYCFSRRRAYIRSARLFADRSQNAMAMADLGRLAPDALFDSIAHLKKNQGIKELMGNPKVDVKVKACLRSLQLCMQNVLGTNAHRMFLRHVVTGYRNLFGPPLVFTTMNVADTKHPLMKLMYDGKDVGTWRLLEESSPDVGPMEEMLQRVAADPVSQALFSDLMMQLFLKHFLGVRLGEDRLFGDSVASSGVPGLFGDVQAFFAPIESQGRGGLHAHMCVWVLQPISSRFLEELRSGEPGPEWKDRLWAWREEVREKVGSMMFDSVEEIGRQCGQELGKLHALRFYPDANDEDARAFRKWCDEVLESRRSLDAFVAKHDIDTSEAGTLKFLWANYQRAHRCSHGDTPTEQTLDEQANANSSAESQQHKCDVCAECSPNPACPRCRPRTCDTGFKASHVPGWHQDLLWRGLEPCIDKDVCTKLLQEARALSDADRRSMALLASLEGFCREATLSGRLRAAAEGCKPGDSILPTQSGVHEAVDAALKFLSQSNPESPQQSCTTSQANMASCLFPVAEDNADVEAFANWHGGLLHSSPDPRRLTRYLEDLRTSDAESDVQATQMSSLRIILSCYTAEVGGDLDSIQKLVDGLCLRAAGTSDARTGSALLDDFLRWRRTVFLPPDIVERYKDLVGLEEGPVGPLPLSANRQNQTRTDGGLEDNEACVFEPPEQSKLWKPSLANPRDAESVLRWRDGSVLQCNRARSYAPLCQERCAPLRPGCSRADPCAELPAWRRLPPYESSASAGGRALIMVHEEEDEEARLFSNAFVADARRNFVRSHIHKCKKTCFKNSSKTGKGGQVCRFNFVHGREVLWYPRRWPKKLTPCRSLHCQMCQPDTDFDRKPHVPMSGFRSFAAGDNRNCKISCRQHPSTPVHPHYCPADVPVGYICRVGVRGKRLVLAKDAKYLPDVSVDELFGGVGKILPLRYHPDCSSSHPALQVGFRCNFDVQCMDRVFVLMGRRQAFQRKRVVVGLDKNRRTVCHDEGGAKTARGAPSSTGARPICVRCCLAIEGQPVLERPMNSCEVGPLHFGCLRQDEAWDYFDNARQAAQSERSHAAMVTSVDSHAKTKPHLPLSGGGTLAAFDDPEAFDFVDETDDVFDIFEEPDHLEAQAQLCATFQMPDSCASQIGVSSSKPASTKLGEWATRCRASDQDVHDDAILFADDGADQRDVCQQQEDTDIVADEFKDELQLNINPAFEDMVAAGRKTLECRVNVGRVKKIKPGDTCLLGRIRVLVTRVDEYEDFKAVLSDNDRLSRALPGTTTVSAGVNIYHSFSMPCRDGNGSDGYEALASRYGVLAFSIEVHSRQLKESIGRTITVSECVDEEYFIHPDRETDHGSLQSDSLSDAKPWWVAAYESFKRVFQDMNNIAHYQTDYSTKANPGFGSELPEQCVGVERLRKEEERDFGLNAESRAALCLAQLYESGRKTMIRLQTAANRAALKKLPEMCSQMLLGHECYASHRHWTIFCKGLLWNGYLASQFQKQATSEGLFERGWTDAKKSLLQRVRQEQPDYVGVDDDDGALVQEDLADSGAVRITGRGRRPKKCARAVAGKQHFEDGDDEDSNPAVSIHIAPDRSLKQDWLHRGDHPLLASMGLYHYAMFVYTTHVQADTVPSDDFFTYRFAPSHPDCRTRVQKLRVHETFRVPKLHGFTMPRDDSGVAEDRFRNAMFKSLLFCPVHVDPEQKLPRSDELAAAFLTLVDSGGAYQDKWRKWLDNQRNMAAQYAELEKRAQRVFTISDVDCNRGYITCLQPETRRPSPSEFMAHITMEVVANLELGAQSRSGRRVCKGIHDFGMQGVPEGADGFYQGEGVGGCDEGAVNQQPHTKTSRPKHPVSAQDARDVAFCRDFVPDAKLLEYYREFERLMGDPMRQKISGGFQNYVHREKCFDWGHHSGQRLTTETFKMKAKSQSEAFRWRKGDSSVVLPDGDDNVEPSNGFIHWNPTKDAGLAELVAEGTHEAVAYIERAIVKLAEGSKPVRLNTEQRDFLALVADHVIQQERYEGNREEEVFEPRRILLHGAGGTGKTEVIKVVRGLYEYLYEADSHRALAASNSAARNVGGDTVHSGLHLNGLCRFSQAELAHQPKPPCINDWGNVRLLILEEVSLISPQMLGGISYRLCKARRGFYDRHGEAALDPEQYTHKMHSFGRIPLVILLGDFMQLAPIGEGKKRISLLMEPNSSWTEESKLGKTMFEGCVTDVVELVQTHRFDKWDEDAKAFRTCPILPSLLSYIRNPPTNSAGLVEELPTGLVDALHKWQVVSGTPEASAAERLERYDMAIAWHAVARLMHYRAAQEASEAGKVLVYVQAVDTCSTQHLDAEEYRRALQVVNMTKTGKLLGMCPLYVGMSVRLNAKLSAKHGLVHDAVGTVEGFVFHPEDRFWNCDDHEARRMGFVVCKHLPEAVLVKFKGFEQDVGFGHGVVAVQPRSESWVYKTHDKWSGLRKQVECSMRRRQIPLAPEKVRTVQTAQGLSMESVAMYLGWPKNMDADDYWLHLYVMLSRAKDGSKVVVHKLPPLDIFKKGPPQWVRSGLEWVSRMVAETLPRVQQARRNVGWPPDKDSNAQDAGLPRDGGSVGIRSASRAPKQCGSSQKNFSAEGAEVPRGSGSVGTSSASRAPGQRGSTSGSKASPRSTDLAPCASVRSSRSSNTRCAGAHLQAGPQSGDINPYLCLLKNESKLSSLSKQRHDPSAWKVAFEFARKDAAQQNSRGLLTLRKLIWRQTQELVSASPSMRATLFTPRTVRLQPGSQRGPACADAPSTGCRTSVLQRDMLEVAGEFVRQDLRVAFLNMANASTPGGGVRNGAGAQEEDLHRRSNADCFLFEQRKGLYPIPDDACLLSEQVVVCRGTEADGYPILAQPFKVTMLSCAALSHPPLRGNQYAKSTDASLMRRKVQLIIDGALRARCDVAVLGAFGCGAFCNPPEQVAQIFQDVLRTSPLKEAVFCIIDDHNTKQSHNPLGNFLPFKNVFDKNPKGSGHLTSGSSGGNANARSSRAPSSDASVRQAFHTALRYDSTTAGRASDEPAHYCSLLEQSGPERLSMYYGLTPGELHLATVSDRICSAGLPNPGVNACFINAALQCFLRLEPVAMLLQNHRRVHSERRRWNPYYCAACVMAELAQEMRSGELVACNRLNEIVRGGDFGLEFASPSAEGRINPQCDAAELFLGSAEVEDVAPEHDGFLGILDKWEETGFWSGEQVVGARVVNEVQQSRHVLGHFLFGLLLRTRKHCTCCHFVTDSLEESSALRVDFPANGASARASFHLLDLIQSEMTPASTGLKCGRDNVAVCSAAGSAIIKQRYIEREPAILAIRLARQQYDLHGQPMKVLARCVFPEVLTFLRTGEYHFAGLLLHQGAGTDNGHYRAITWHRGGEYWLFDDNHDVRAITWRDTQTVQVQRECYMLLYVRTRFWDDVPSDGTERTPYARDMASLQFVQQNSATSPASRGTSNPSSSSGAHSSGGQREHVHNAQRADDSTVACSADTSHTSLRRNEQQLVNLGQAAEQSSSLFVGQISSPSGGADHIVQPADSNSDSAAGTAAVAMRGKSHSAKKRLAPVHRDLQRTSSLIGVDPVHLSTRSRRARTQAPSAAVQATTQVDPPAPRNLD